MDDKRESQRLKSKVDPDAFIQKFIAPSITINTQSILDVGCGSGIITATLSKLYPNISITGLDLSEERFNHEKQAHSNLDNLTFVKANAKKMPFDNEQFDIVFIRFLLEYCQSPLSIIKEMTRITKPNGFVILQDLDSQLTTHYPENNLLQNRIEIILKHLSKSGFDPYIGRKLFHLAKQTSLTSLDLKIEPYHVFAGKIDSYNKGLWELKLDIALPEIAKALGSIEKAKLFKKDYLMYLENESTLTFSNLFTLIGKKQ